MKTHHYQSGFTLVEMAIVLVIIGLLIGGLLVPLATQKEQEKRSENAALLDEAVQALIGFAVVHGRLPCPDTDALTSPTRGQENTCAADNTTAYYGRLPWVTLGINAEFDPWADGTVTHTVHYAVNGTYVGPFTLDAESLASMGSRTLEVHTNATDCGSAINKVAENVPAVVWTTAKNAYTASADEVKNATNDECFVSRRHSTDALAPFDDQLVWISPAILFNRMISAGRLP
jgi:prepilin-type N-terminal cleavage/methylation domain-containing protein